MPPAALISILQKGLQYVEAEISINEVSTTAATTTSHWDVPSSTPQQPQHEPLPSFSSSGFILFLVLCPIPAESQKALRWQCFSVFLALAGRRSLCCLGGYSWVFLLPWPTNPGCTGSCSNQKKVPVLTILCFQGHSRIWQEKPAAQVKTSLPDTS